jgi:hypothetical protein
MPGALLLMMLSGSVAHADDCEKQISLLTRTVNLNNYVTPQGSSWVAEFPLELRRSSSSEACSVAIVNPTPRYFFGLSGAGSTLATGELLNNSLGTCRSLPSLWTVDFSPGQQSSFITVRLRVDMSTAFALGQYRLLPSSPFSLTLYSRNSQGHCTDQGYQLTLDDIQFTPQASLAITIGPEGAPYTPGQISHQVDFGALKKDAIRRFDIMVLASTPAALTVRAQNQALVNTKAQDARIAYSLTPFTALDGSTRLPVGAYRNTPEVFRSTLAIQILSDPSTAVAGDYRETLTFEVTYP